MTTTVIRIGLVICVLVSPRVAGAQEAMEYRLPGVAPRPMAIVELRREGAERVSALEQLWRAADSDDDRAEVEEMVSELMNQQFDADLKRRKAEMKKIMDRVALLKKQLDRRIKKRDEIVAIQVKQTTMTWDGLGWNGAGPRKAGGHGLFTLGAAEGGRATWVADKQGHDSLAALVSDAALTDSDRLVFLTSSLAKRLQAGDAAAANETLWMLYEKTHQKVENRDYWMALIEAGEHAIKHADNDTVRSNTLDTVARMYEQLGDLEKALQLQEKALELQPHSGQLRAFMRTLKSDLGHDDEDGGDNEFMLDEDADDSDELR